MGVARSGYTIIVSTVICFVSLVATLGAAFADECADDDALKKHVMLLEARGSGGKDPRHASGVLVHSSGLVLTTFALIKDLELKDNKKLELMGLMDEGTLTEFNINLIAPVALKQKATILGFDSRRSILLLKVSLSNDDALQPIPVSSRSMKGELDLCFVGYDEDGMVPTVKSAQSGESTTGVHWRTDIGVDARTLGGAVIRQENGELAGLISNNSDGGTEFLPIEFTDTLLSQLFIARIVSYMEPLQWKLDWKLAVQSDILTVEAKHYMGGGPNVDFIKLVITCRATVLAAGGKVEPSRCGYVEPPCALEARAKEPAVFEYELSDAFKKIARAFEAGDKYEKVFLQFTVTPLLKSQVKSRSNGCWEPDMTLVGSKTVENKFEQPIQRDVEVKEFSMITKYSTAD